MVPRTTCTAYNGYGISLFHPACYTPIKRISRSFTVNFAGNLFAGFPIRGATQILYRNLRTREIVSVQQITPRKRARMIQLENTQVTEDQEDDDEEEDFDMEHIV